MCVYIYNFRSNEQFSGPYGPYGDGVYLFRFQRPSSVSVLCYKSSTVLSKAFILMVMIYYNKRIQIKISNRERCVRPGLEDTRQKLPVVSMKSHGFCFLFSTMICKNTSRVCASCFSFKFKKNWLFLQSKMQNLLHRKQSNSSSWENLQENF